MFSIAAVRAFFDPGLYFGNVEDAVIVLHQQREFIELLRNVRFTLSKETVEEVKERDVGIGQLHERKKIENVC